MSTETRETVRAAYERQVSRMRERRSPMSAEDSRDMEILSRVQPGDSALQGRPDSGEIAELVRFSARLERAFWQEQFAAGCEKWAAESDGGTEVRELFVGLAANARETARQLLKEVEAAPAPPDAEAQASRVRVQPGRYEVYSNNGPGTPYHYRGTFRVVDGATVINSQLDELNCNFFPAGPMTSFSDARFLHRLDNDTKNPYVTSFNDEKMHSLTIRPKGAPLDRH